MKIYRLYFCQIILVLILGINCFLLSSCVSYKVSAQSQLKNYQLTVAGQQREYLVFQPKLTSSGPMPLMVVLHGGLGNAQYVAKKTNMNQIADQEKFLVAYPNGIGGRIGRMKDRRTWNAGSCCGRAKRKNIDDVTFIREMITVLINRYKIDSKRIYITGHSNGAMLAYRVACEIPEMITAIMPVAGTLAVNQCKNAENVAVYHIHGDSDQNVPVGGGMGSKSIAGVRHRSLIETLTVIARDRGCDLPESLTQVPKDEDFTFKCSRGAPIVMRIVGSGRHAWPDGRAAANGGSFIASEAIWRVIKKYNYF